MNKNIQEILQTATCDAFFANAPMEPLKLFDSAEVRSNKCPICHTPYHLEKDCRFKVCVNCGANFKVWGNKAYYIPNSNYDKEADINERILRNMKINRLKDFSS